MRKKRGPYRLWDDVLHRLTHVAEMPLGSPADFAIRWRTDEAGALRTLVRLEKEKWVDHVRRGNARRRQDRFWITPEGVHDLYDSTHAHPSLRDIQRVEWLEQTGDDAAELQNLLRRFSWDHTHSPFGDQEDHEHAPRSAALAGIREIFTRLELAEEAYPIAPTLLLSDQVIPPWDLPEWVRGLGLTEIRWLRSGRLYHLLARYGDNWWVAFTYVGIHAKGTVIKDKRDGRFEGVARYEWPPGERRPDYSEVREDPFEPKPSLHVVVAADGWARALAKEHLGPAAVSSTLWTGDRDCLPVQLNWSRSLVADPFRVETVGARDPNAGNGIHGWLEGRPDLSAINSMPAYRMVTLVSQFPALQGRELKELTRASGKRFRPVLTSLYDSRVLFKDAGGVYLDERGIQFAADVSRTSIEVVREICSRWLQKEQRDRYHQHNRGVARLALAFFRAGGEPVGGWRATTDAPGLTQIQPDAMIELVDGPCGPDWYRIEFERSAVTRRNIAKKLRTFRAMAAAGTPVPALFVCETEIVARRVVEIGQDLRVAATTLELATAGAIDGPGVWLTQQGPARISCKPSSARMSRP